MRLRYGIHKWLKRAKWGEEPLGVVNITSSICGILSYTLGSTELLQKVMTPLFVDGVTLL